MTQPYFLRLGSGSTSGSLDFISPNRSASCWMRNSIMFVLFLLVSSQSWFNRLFASLEKRNPESGSLLSATFFATILVKFGYICLTKALYKVIHFITV